MVWQHQLGSMQGGQPWIDTVKHLVALPHLLLGKMQCSIHSTQDAAQCVSKFSLGDSTKLAYVPTLEVTEHYIEPDGRV